MMPASSSIEHIDAMRWLLEECHPYLLVVVSDADFFLRRQYKKHFLVVSSLRKKQNDTGVHAAGRACDGRVRDPKSGIYHLPENEQHELCDYLNTKYPYGNGLFTAISHIPGNVIVKPTEDRPIFESPTASAPHIHIQVPWGYNVRD